MNKSIIAFDLDGTLAESKSSITPEMDKALSALLDHKTVCVISGGRFEQFQDQFLNSFSATPNEYDKLHLMPTSGTHYLRFREGEWQTVYREIIPENDRKQIIDALQAAVENFGYDKLQTYGEQIQDRKSQVTLSVFGQDIVEQLGEEGIKIKKAWDPDASKRKQIAEFVETRLPEGIDAMVGGKSSVDVVLSGVDKSYGVKKLAEATGVNIDEILFIGDELQEGGNDHSVKRLGVDTISVDTPSETLDEIKKILEEL